LHGNRGLRRNTTINARYRTAFLNNKSANRKGTWIVQELPAAVAKPCNARSQASFFGTRSATCDCQCISLRSCTLGSNCRNNKLQAATGGHIKQPSLDTREN